MQRIGARTALRRWGGSAAALGRTTLDNAETALYVGRAFFGTDFFKNVGQSLRSTGDKMQQQFNQMQQSGGGGCPGGQCGNSGNASPFQWPGTAGGNQQQQQQTPWQQNQGGQWPSANQQQQQQGGGQWPQPWQNTGGNQQQQQQQQQQSGMGEGNSWFSGGAMRDLDLFRQMRQGGSGGNGGGGGGGGGGGPFGGGGGGGGGGPFGGMFDQMLEWCSKAHAQDIARRMNIDLHDIKFHFDGAGNCQVQVDAPNASAEQIRQLGQAVQEECPVARYRKTRMANSGGGDQGRMDWVPLPPPSPK